MVSSEIRTTRILVLFPGALGDIICLLPTLAKLLDRHPNASIELMASPGLGSLFVARAVLKPFPSRSDTWLEDREFFSVAQAHSLDCREVAALFAGDDDALAETARFLSDFCHVYSLFAYDRAVYRSSLARLLGPRVTFGRFWTSAEGHIAKAYAQELGLTLEEGDLHRAYPWLLPTESDVATAQRVLERVGLSARRFILLLPGSGNPLKNWSAEKFIGLAELLRRTYKEYRVAVLLGPAEERLRKAFLESELTLLENLELPVAAAVISRAAAFVGNDSGISHLAAALGVPGVVLFGPTNPERWSPLGKVKVVARSKLSSLSESEVFSQLDEMLVVNS